MKFVVALVVALIAFAAVASAAILSEEQNQFLFVRFVEQYNKSYETNEMLTRYNIFTANLELIIAHNAQNLPWKLGVNELVDLTPAEASKKMGLKVIANANSEFSQDVVNAMKNVKIQSTDAAADINWVTKGAVNAVKNQASCGSCWAFSAISVIETATFIDQGKLQELSEQQMVDCDKVDSGCNGGLPEPALTWAKTGVCTSAEYPYNGKDGSCKSCNAVTKVTSFDKINPSDTCANHIVALQKGTISIGVAASQSAFMYYSSGIITQCTGKSLDHAVTIVGTASENGVQYMLIRNSWGASWGEAGYVRIAAEGNKCGICSQAYDRGNVLTVKA